MSITTSNHSGNEHAKETKITLQLKSPYVGGNFTNMQQIMSFVWYTHQWRREYLFSLLRRFNCFKQINNVANWSSTGFSLIASWIYFSSRYFSTCTCILHRTSMYKTRSSEWHKSTMWISSWKHLYVGQDYRAHQDIWNNRFQQYYYRQLTRHAAPTRSFQ